MNCKIDLLLKDLATQGYALPTSININIKDKLSKYAELIDKWNKVHDLVSHKHYDDIYDHHILDSLAAFIVYRSSQKILPEYYLDIGSGAGLPGIVWHILFEEEVNTILIEPRAKRVNFLKEVRKSLNLKNLEISESRFDKLPSASKLVLGTLRALKPEDQIIKEFLLPNSSSNTLVWLASESPDLESLPKGIKFETVKYHYGESESYLRSLIIFKNGLR